MFSGNRSSASPSKGLDTLWAIAKEQRAMADTNVSDTEAMAEPKDGWGDIDDIRRNFQKGGG